jgi:hypothetical protein
MNQIITCTFFKVSGFSNKWWAFTQMQLGFKALKGIKGLSFFKLMGSGANNGFSSIPNFGTYVLLCVWDSEQIAQDFFLNHSFFKNYKSRSKENFTVHMNSSEVHGKWDGEQPFLKNADLAADMPVMVLTRARIRFMKLWSFWTKVGKVSQSLEQYKGNVLSIGVGEWPLIQQATLSIWRTQSEMLDYAYKNQKHKEVVMMTRKLNWYSEEMFARFVPFKFEGFWNGKDVASLL